MGVVLVIFMLNKFVVTIAVGCKVIVVFVGFHFWLRNFLFRFGLG